MTTAAPKAEKIVLYVDDNQDTCEMVTLMLQPANIKVEVARSSAEGCQKAQLNHYDLILLDSYLPDGSGVGLCQRIREFNQQTPILFYSAQAYEEQVQLAINAGAQDYLVKPDDTEHLVMRIRFHTNSHHFAR